MAVVAKKDIDILTKQLLYAKCEILEVIRCEHITIDSSLLYEHFVPKFEAKLNKTKESRSVSINDECDTVSLVDIEDIVRRFDILDKSLQETTSTTNNIGNITARKEMHGIKRFGSMTNINKTLLRSSSSLNLNSTKIFAEPQVPALRSSANCGVALTNTTNNDHSVTHKFSLNQLFEHNMLKEEVEVRLDSMSTEVNSYMHSLSDIGQKFKTSSDRLNTFFAEVQQIQSKKCSELDQDVSLMDLDEELLGFMRKLSQALIQVQFIAKNQNLYNSNGIKGIDSPLSDDLTDILEQFYRTSN